MAGRPPKPTALKVLTGTDQVHKERLNQREPKPRVARPKRPSWMARRARRHWSQAMTTLEAMGVLTVADGAAVALMANALAEYIEAAQLVEEHGLLIEERDVDAEGNVFVRTIKANPAAAARADSWRRVNLMLQQFGLTPASRAKVRVEKREEVDEFEALLRKAE